MKRLFSLALAMVFALALGGMAVAGVFHPLEGEEYITGFDDDGNPIYDIPNPDYNLCPVGTKKCFTIYGKDEDGNPIEVGEYYVTYDSAYDMLDPESGDYNSNAYILDVRTPAEWYWVGHPGKDKCGNGAFLEEPVRKVINIPWYVWEYVPQDKEYDRKIPNRFFDEEVVRQFDPDDIIINMCRSGSRSVSASEELEEPSHSACKRLEELGYYNIYNMLEGFEGGRNKATDPPNCQHRTKDEGWKNKKLPYVDNDKGIWTPHQRGRSLAK